MEELQKLIYCLETHDVEGIKICFQNGINPNDLFKNAPLIFELTSGYARTPRFKECVKMFVNYGLNFPDQALLAILLNDVDLLQIQLDIDPSIVFKKYDLRCSYTPLFQATLLHICAEFNHVDCAKVLLQNGANIDAEAGIDENGFGGQTAIFHTVNQNNNQSIDMLTYLLPKSPDLKIQLKGLIWGKGYDWETFIPAINPISYAMMGNLPQMHRDVKIISTIISKLLKAAYQIDYVPANVPCKYLQNQA